MSYKFLSHEITLVGNHNDRILADEKDLAEPLLELSTDGSDIKLTVWDGYKSTLVISICVPAADFKAAVNLLLQNQPGVIK